MAEGVRGRKPSSGERALLTYTDIYRAALLGGVGGHYSQIPIPFIGGLVEDFLDPRNRDVAREFGHWIYTIYGGGQL